MIIDTHAHYYDGAFDADRDEVLSAYPDAQLESDTADGVVWTAAGSSSITARATCICASS